MKKNTKLSVQRQTLKALGTDRLEAVAGARPPTSEPTQYRCPLTTSDSTNESQGC